MNFNSIDDMLIGLGNWLGLEGKQGLLAFLTDVGASLQDVVDYFQASGGVIG